MDIRGAELFKIGRWNGILFKSTDLDAIFESFAALGLAGRVPLKFGHNDEQPLTDGQPALGWVTRVYRQGDVLKGDFSDVPRVVHEAIKAGNYKFVSVELLRDVVAGGREYAWVLSAVALLGADIPAVSNLNELRQLTMARRAEFSSGTRMTFTVGGQDSMTETEKLKAENAKLQEQLVDQAIDMAIIQGKCLPFERKHFSQRFGKTATLQDWNDWLQMVPRPPANLFKRAHESGPVYDSRGEEGQDSMAGNDGPPDVQVVRLAEAEIEKSGGKLTYREASQRVLRANPELAKDYQWQPGVKE